MQRYTVAKDGTGDFSTITDALAAADLAQPLTILLKRGIYREKVFAPCVDLTLEGESRETTLLVYADGAKHFAADGTALGTFRSYTACFSGGRVVVKNMSIANTAGDGRIHGQAVAACVYSARAYFENVELFACQDTLFTGPLPEKERQPDGFLGPFQTTKRIKSVQYYKNCSITGDIDYVFGGADALFEECSFFCRDRGEAVNGYLAAPSGFANGIGYVFYHCDIEGTAPKSFYLARPWRPEGKAAFLQCRLSDTILPQGFDDWNDAANRSTCTFAEYGNTGEGAAGPRAFGTALTAEQARMLLQKIRTKVSEIFAEKPCNKPFLWYDTPNRP